MAGEGFVAKVPLALAGRALEALFFVLLGGAVFVQTLLRLTLKSSGLAYGKPLTLPVSPAETPLYLAHALFTGI